MTTKVKGYAFNEKGVFGPVNVTIPQGESAVFFLFPHQAGRMDVIDSEGALKDGAIVLVGEMDREKEPPRDIITHWIERSVLGLPHKVECGSENNLLLRDRNEVQIINPLAQEGNTPVLDIRYENSSVRDRARR
jgi:hypothetical protein